MSHNVEHLAVCAHFVDNKREVHEEFLSLIRLERITGKQMAQALITFLQDNLFNWLTYMIKGMMGLQTCQPVILVYGLVSLATYAHCGGHCLNLVRVKSCALPDVRNVLDCLDCCCRFFLNSPKQSGLLQLVVLKMLQTPRKGNHSWISARLVRTQSKEYCHFLI